MPELGGRVLVRSWAASHSREHAAAAYTSALLERFGNRRVRHQLSQIAPDGSRKLPIRIFPTLRAERMPIGGATVIAAWVLHLRGHGAPVKDDAAAAAQAAAADPDLTSAVAACYSLWIQTFRPTR